MVRWHQSLKNAQLWEGQWCWCFQLGACHFTLFLETTSDLKRESNPAVLLCHQSCSCVVYTAVCNAMGRWLDTATVIFSLSAALYPLTLHFQCRSRTLLQPRRDALATDCNYTWSPCLAADWVWHLGATAKLIKTHLRGGNWIGWLLFLFCAVCSLSFECATFGKKKKKYFFSKDTNLCMDFFRFCRYSSTKLVRVSGVYSCLKLWRGKWSQLVGWSREGRFVGLLMLLFIWGVRLLDFYGNWK